MSRDLEWDELIARLEADLRARSGPEASGDTDESAWEQALILVRKYARVLGSLGIGLGSEEVDDLAQDALMKLHSLEFLKRVILAGSPSGYIVVMVRNAAYDRVRARAREGTVLRQLAREPRTSPEAEQVSPADQVLLRLRQELQLLSEEERALLKMRFWKGMAIQDIAQETHSTYSGVAVKLFRLLKRLRSGLEQI
jgi:RNA polymerase sigma factor (sigma-70 family)